MGAGVDDPAPRRRHPRGVSHVTAYGKEGSDAQPRHRGARTRTIPGGGTVLPVDPSVLDPSPGAELPAGRGGGAPAPPGGGVAFSHPPGADFPASRYVPRGPSCDPEAMLRCLIVDDSLRFLDAARGLLEGHGVMVVR